jgi:hypothetical protein
MDQLLARGELNSGAEMYLDALSDLVVAYEDEHYAIEPASDADMLRHLMEVKGVTQATEQGHDGPQVHGLQDSGGEEAPEAADDSQVRGLFRSSCEPA